MNDKLTTSCVGIFMFAEDVTILFGFDDRIAVIEIHIYQINLKNVKCITV